MDPIKNSDEFNHVRCRFVGSARLNMVRLLTFTVSVLLLRRLACAGAPVDFPANVQGLWI
jgi:hypothetical protein